MRIYLIYSLETPILFHIVLNQKYKYRLVQHTYSLYQVVQVYAFYENNLNLGYSHFSSKLLYIYVYV